MADQIIKVENRIKRFGSQLIEKAQSYTLERLVWCVAAVFMCWTQVQNYHEYIFWQQIYIMSAVGIFYCLKLGAFQKGKRLLCGVATACGIGLTIYFVKINFYASYYYLDMPLGIFITVLLNLYILVIYDAVKERRFPFEVSPSILLFFLLILKQTSIYDYKRFYLYILLSLLPLIMMKKSERACASVLKGMLDGICIGFFVIQGYAWKHRPYNYSDIRYTGISNSCTTMSRIYLSYFAAWMIQYVQLARKKWGIWNGMLRVFSWLTATFILSLEYLTGSRSAVLAMILMTVIAMAVRYIRLKDAWWKWIGKAVLWIVNCACVGLVSLALFPTAYASVRYLPAYYNQPDYINYTGYRMLSRPIQVWGEYFFPDNEYNEFSVMENEAVDSVKYATFEESVEHNLGRIIPGAGAFLERVLASDLLYSGRTRAEYYYEQGIYTQAQFDEQMWYVEYWYGSKGSSDDNVTEDELETDNKITQVYSKLLEKILSSLVLRIDAEDMAPNSMEVLPSGSRGDSSEYPWYTEEEYPGNGMGLRMAIHEYAISKLNNEGHKEGSFRMWVTSWNQQPHAHNIFLIAGYNFGIPTMIMMILLFIMVFLVAIYNVIRFGKIEYLLPALLIAGMTVFGWFESGFTYKSEMMVWIFLCTIFTNVYKKDERKSIS